MVWRSVDVSLPVKSNQIPPLDYKGKGFRSFSPLVVTIGSKGNLSILKPAPTLETIVNVRVISFAIVSLIYS